MAKAKKSAAKKSKPAAKSMKAKSSAGKSANKANAKKAVAKKPVNKSKVVAKKSIGKGNNKVKSSPVKSASKALQNFVTPLDDRLIVEISSGEKRTAGGLYIPETSNVTGQFKGKVLAAGRGHRDTKGRLRPMDVKAGDIVLFAEFSGSKINLMGQDFQILRESEVLGIVEKG